MADFEEPPAKVTKLELAPPSADSTVEGAEEGQEEWLSEGVLTDDDYVGGEHDKSDSQAATSQDESTMQGTENPPQLLGEDDETNFEPPTEHSDPKPAEEKEKNYQNDIEQTLNNFENSQTAMPASDLPDDLDTFLIRKTDGKVVDSKPKEDNKESEPEDSPKHSDNEDDGHDTDDLLRMLGEDDEKVPKNHVLKTIKEKKALVRVRDQVDSDGDDEDEYIFEGAKVTRLKMAKNALIRTYPGRVTKAVPEESDTDMSSDETVTVEKIFGVNKQMSPLSNTAQPPKGPAKKVITKHVVNLNVKPSHSTPIIQYNNKKLESKLLPKSDDEKKQKVDEKEHDEIINEEEFLEEDNFDLNEEFADESDTELDARKQKQRIMRPEQMDEEIPTDAESLSGDGSLYDELPSSESEELQDWFTLDIRAERAGDYLPLLGPSAYQVLSEEKRRVTSRLATLRHSLTALTDTGRQQADELRKATITLAELDAMLAAS